MKRFVSVIFSFVLATIILTPLQAFADEGIVFDELGVRADVNVTNLGDLNEERKLASEDWVSFPSKKNVPLDKEWSINFSAIATHDKIDAIVIERNAQYIPVMITLTNSKQVKVRPVGLFSGNANYTMKILLSDGKKYKMNFTTVSTPRNADIEPNNFYLQSPEVYLNETIKGEITQEDVDFFKVEVPDYGTLNVNLTGYSGKRMALHLYGSTGNNQSAITSDSHFTQGGISTGLMPGTYYIRVSTLYSVDSSPYELEIDFKQSTLKDDSGTINYLDAKLIALNDSFTGHVGYFNNYNHGNFQDYFKIEVPSHGTLSIDLTGYNGKGMTLHLYGSTGNNQSAIAYKSHFTQGGISKDLMPGTYYVRVSTVNAIDYSPYKIETKFVKKQ